jgi:hypothetical protein
MEMNDRIMVSVYIYVVNQEMHIGKVYFNYINNRLHVSPAYVTFIRVLCKNTNKIWTTFRQDIPVMFKYTYTKKNKAANCLIKTIDITVTTSSAPVVVKCPFMYC